MQISIVTPVKNGARSIDKMLASLERQSYQSFELLVVDGGSTDATEKTVKASSLRSCQFISDPGSGITRAVNLGIAAAKGSIIMPWLCADDYLDERFLERVAATFSNSNADFVYGSWHIVQDGRLIKSRTPEEGWERKIKYYMPLILPNAFAFQKRIFAEIGLLNEDLMYANDYDLLRRVLKAGYKGSRCVDAWYYFRAGGISQARHAECAREVAKAAISHGSGRVLTSLHYVARYCATRISFGLNQWRTRNAQVISEKVSE
jgi:glycosyltransferase